MKKLGRILLALLLVCSLMPSALAYEWNLEGTIFPVTDAKKLQILTSGYRDNDIRKISENLDWQSLVEQTGVNLEFVYLGDYEAPETRESLQLRLLNNDYCDAIMSVYVDTLNVADINDMAGAGMLIPLEDYLTNPEIMPNYYNNVYSKRPDILKNMQSPDGHVYYLAGANETVAYTSGEGLMMVNSEWLKAWKEARQLDHTPATLDEFEDMLRYFRDNDMNGNGANNDEIPYMIAQSAWLGCMTLEHAMGMYGVGTKDSTADMNIMIGDDGQAFFVHTQDMYKAALKSFSKWYKENLIWSEIFTGNSETITNIMADAKNKVGVFNACSDVEGFEPMLPPAIDGYQARYLMHCSLRTGVRQPYAVITEKCADPAQLCSFLDLMFDFQNNTRILYGEYSFDSGYIRVNDEGKYVFDKTIVPEEKPTTANASIYSFLCFMDTATLANYEKYIDMDSYFGGSARAKGYEMYQAAGIWNPTGNLWPRCSLLEEDKDDYAFLYADVAATVAEYRAKFVTGAFDVDEKWDEFQTKLENQGVGQMRDIIQRAYDAYVNK